MTFDREWASVKADFRRTGEGDDVNEGRDMLPPEAVPGLRDVITKYVDAALGGRHTPEEVAQGIIDELVTPASQKEYERREEAFQEAFASIMAYYNGLLRSLGSDMEREKQRRRQAEVAIRELRESAALLSEEHTDR